jgi:hypothetical protein
MIELYLIIIKKGNSFKIKLFVLLKIHLVFALNLFYKDKNNPLPG